MRFSRGTVAAIAAATVLVLLLPAVAIAADGPTGVVQVSTAPPGASVFVNGVRVNGVTPINIRLPALQHQEVVVNLYGYQSASQTVMLQPDQTLPLHFDLQVVAGASGPATDTPGAVGSAPAPGETGGPVVTQEIWEEDVPFPVSAAVLSLAVAGLLAARRRR